jgi:hypothetical protein
VSLDGLDRLRPDEEEQIDEATRKEEAAARKMPTTDESLDRIDAEKEALDVSGTIARDSARRALEIEEVVCERQGCGVIMNLDTDISWKTPTGRRCAECGAAEPK